MFSCVSKGYLWIMLILSSVSKVLPKRFNVFGNSLIILGDMINLCLSSSILVVQHFWFIRSFLNPHYHIPLFTSYDQIAWRRDPSLEQNGRGESLHCINSSDLSSFMLWDSFIPVKASIIEGQIHPLLYKTAMLQWPQIPTDSNPSEITFQTETPYRCWIEKKFIKSLKIEIPFPFYESLTIRDAPLDPEPKRGVLHCVQLFLFSQVQTHLRFAGEIMDLFHVLYAWLFFFFIVF